MVFAQHEIEAAVLDHFEKIFVGKRIPVYPVAPLPDQVSLSILELEQILGQNSPSFKSDHFENKVCSPSSFIELGGSI